MSQNSLKKEISKCFNYSLLKSKFKGSNYHYKDDSYLETIVNNIFSYNIHLKNKFFNFIIKIYLIFVRYVKFDIIQILTRFYTRLWYDITVLSLYTSTRAPFFWLTNIFKNWDQTPNTIVIKPREIFSIIFDVVIFAFFFAFFSDFLNSEYNFLNFLKLTQADKYYFSILSISDIFMSVKILQICIISIVCHIDGVPTPMRLLPFFFDILLSNCFFLYEILTSTEFSDCKKEQTKLKIKKILKSFSDLFLIYIVIGALQFKLYLFFLFSFKKIFNLFFYELIHYSSILDIMFLKRFTFRDILYKVRPFLWVLSQYFFPSGTRYFLKGKKFFNNLVIKVSFDDNGVMSFKGTTIPFFYHIFRRIIYFIITFNPFFIFFNFPALNLKNLLISNFGIFSLFLDCELVTFFAMILAFVWLIRLAYSKKYSTIKKNFQDEFLNHSFIIFGILQLLLLYGIIITSYWYMPAYFPGNIISIVLNAFNTFYYTDLFNLDFPLIKLFTVTFSPQLFESLLSTLILAPIVEECNKRLMVKILLSLDLDKNSRKLIINSKTMFRAQFLINILFSLLEPIGRSRKGLFIENFREAFLMNIFKHIPLTSALFNPTFISSLNSSIFLHCASNYFIMMLGPYHQYLESLKFFNLITEPNSLKKNLSVLRELFAFPKITNMTNIFDLLYFHPFCMLCEFFLGSFVLFTYYNLFKEIFSSKKENNKQDNKFKKNKEYFDKTLNENIIIKNEFEEN